MSETLTYQKLKDTVLGNAIAIKCVTEYQPAGGPGDKVFPPTYAGAEYATEKRLVNGEVIDSILLDSVQSQANRMEIAIKEIWTKNQIKLPVIETDFSGLGLPSEIGVNWKITTLDAPHRIADALFRDSVLEDGTPFRLSEYAERWGSAKPYNATPLLELCPTALLLGMWGSPKGPGGMGGKFARLIVSEIVGYKAYSGVRTSSRIDPAQITIAAGPLYAEGNGSWTLDNPDGSLKKFGNKDKPSGKPSEAGHGNIAPTIEKKGGGVTIERAVQTTVLSLTALRKLCFPIEGTQSESVDIAVRAYLAALGILGATLVREHGCDLRSRCLLIPINEFKWGILGGPQLPVEEFVLSPKDAVSIYHEAYQMLENLGFNMLGKLTLRPNDQLAKLVKKSQELTTSGQDEAED